MLHPGNVDIAFPAGAAADSQGRVSFPGQNEGTTVTWSPDHGVELLLLHEGFSRAGPLHGSAGGIGWMAAGWAVSSAHTGYVIHAEGGSSFASSARELDLKCVFRALLSDRRAPGVDLPGQRIWVLGPGVSAALLGCSDSRPEPRPTRR